MQEVVPTETDLVRERYARRAEQRAKTGEPAGICRPEVYLGMQEKERALIRWIREAGIAPVAEKRLLEVGCGSGGNLLQFLRLGFRPENLVGNDLLEERVERARRQLPAVTQILPGDACALNLEPESFDVVFQSTVFTSLLDREFQARLAAEIWCWTKPGGGVLWYDFLYDNPANPDVKGVSLARVRELFPQGRLNYRRLTLAPPISRRVTRLHPSLYHAFNSVPMLRTHVLCWISKPR